MLGLTHRGPLRWKEWVPLVTQQLRLRGLIEIRAYNVRKEGWSEKEGLTRSYYYTLHLTSMSSPFYTSEKLESDNPKWAEVDINTDIGAAPGVIVRVWVSSGGCGESDGAAAAGGDEVVVVWAVAFSGLVYVGARPLGLSASLLAPNTLLFHMHAGYFTATHCLLDHQPATPRTLSVELPASHVKPSYSLNLLLRLQGMQQGIARQGATAAHMREEILSGKRVYPGQRGATEGRALRRLLAHDQPPPRHMVNAIQKLIESFRFRVQLLYDQRDCQLSTVNSLRGELEEKSRSNHIRGCQLMDKVYKLSKEVERLRSLKQENSEVRGRLHQVSALLDQRRKHLISQMSHIYPIKQERDGVYSISGVRLPDSESLEGEDVVRVSVALGFVAHLVQMMSVFLNVPTRYPICHQGSRSKIIDHITNQIPDKDREFPLYRGKEKLHFDYGLYLLNKNIAQLRWCYGIATTDLKATLPNLLPLLSLSNKDDKHSLPCGAALKKAERGDVSSGAGSSSPQPDPQFYLRTWGEHSPPDKRGPSPTPPTT